MSLEKFQNNDNASFSNTGLRTRKLKLTTAQKIPHNSRHFYLFLVKKIFHVRIPSRCAFISFELWRLIMVWSRRRRLCSTNRIQTKPTPIYMFFVVRHLRVSCESLALQNANLKLSKGLSSPMKGKISLTRTKRSYLLLSRSIKIFPIQ